MTKFSLKRLTSGLEDGIIAGVDLVTGGNILKNQPALTLIWAITLLLTLDFQVLALGVRGHRIYQSNKATGRKVLEVLLVIASAAAISFVSIQMQSIIARVNAEGITIDQAAAQLGISMIALTWERSTLVLVLIFMSGWLREEGKPTVSLEGITAATPAPALQGNTVVTATAQVPAPLQIAAPENALANQKQIDGKGELSTDEPIMPLRFQSKEPAIRAALARMPEASTEQIAREAGTTPRTAQRWLDKIRSEQA